MFDPEPVRADFPILSRRVGRDKPLVYLDNAATSQKPAVVIEAIADYYRFHNANVHRGVHQLGDESTNLFETSRQAIASFLGAKVTELVLVSNETMAANLLAYSWGSTLPAGSVILTTEMEHHSNIVPWQQLAERINGRVEFVRVTAAGRLDMGHFAHQLRQHQPRLVAVSHVSNTLGTLNPLSEIAQLVRQVSAQSNIFVDGAQAAPHLPVRFDQLDVDFYAVSAHKMLGPMGIGGLLIKQAVLQQLEPFLTGGGMIDTVTPESSSWANELTDRWVAGTPNVADTVGWAAACQYLDRFSAAELITHDQRLIQQTLQILAEFPAVKVIGPTVPQAESNQEQQQWSLELDRVGSVAFTYQGVHAHDVAQVLASEGVAVRSGHHCTMPLHQRFGWAATTRVSFQLYTTAADLLVFQQALHKVAEVFGQ